MKHDAPAASGHNLPLTTEDTFEVQLETASGSRYRVTWDAEGKRGSLTRHPSARGVEHPMSQPLRRDGETLLLLHFDRIDLGHPTTFQVDLRGDSVSTFRWANPSVSIQGTAWDTNHAAHADEPDGAPPNEAETTDGASEAATAAAGPYLSGQSSSYASDESVSRPETSGSPAGQSAKVNEIATLIGPFWSADRVRSALGGIDRETLDRMGRKGEVLGVTTPDGVTIYPVKQFDRLAGGAQVKPAIQRFTRALRHLDPWTVAVLLNTPSPELQGSTPLEWDREGEHGDALLDLALILAKEIR